MVLADWGSLSEDHRGVVSHFKSWRPGSASTLALGLWCRSTRSLRVLDLAWVAASPGVISPAPVHRFLAAGRRGCPPLLVLGPAGALDPGQRRWLPVPMEPGGEGAAAPGAVQPDAVRGPSGYFDSCLSCSRCRVPCGTCSSREQTADDG